MGTGDRNQNSILKGILQNGSTFNYPGKSNINVVRSTIASSQQIVLIQYPLNKS